MSENLLAAALAAPVTAPLAVSVPVPADAARMVEIPDKFRDPETGALRVEALLRSYAELERRLSQRLAPPAPDAPDEDKLRFRRAIGVPDLPDQYEIAPPHELCSSDADINAKLHAANFTPAQAQLVYDLAAERLLPLLADAAAQFESERQVQRLQEHFGGEASFRRIAPQIASWGRANLPKPVYEALSTTHEGVLALHQMMHKAEPEMARPGEAQAPGGEAELRAMMRDPRYWRTREPEFVRRVTDGFRRLVSGD